MTKEEDLVLTKNDEKIDRLLNDNENILNEMELEKHIPKINIEDVFNTDIPDEDLKGFQPVGTHDKYMMKLNEILQKVNFILQIMNEK